MICWDDKLYMDDKVEKNLAKYQKRIVNKSHLGCFCIAVADNPENSLEIYASRTPWFRYQISKGVRIVGVAVSYDRALDLLVKIIEDVRKDQGKVDTAAIRKFFGV